MNNGSELETLLRPRGAMSSRGRDLARQLLAASCRASTGKQRQFVLEIAQLMYDLSPGTGRKQPLMAVLMAAQNEAVMLRARTAQEAGCPAILADREESMVALVKKQLPQQVQSMWAYVLAAATLSALVMGMATVPFTLQFHREERTERSPSVRERSLAQFCHHRARKLLSLLPPPGK
jgi:hypothetical protein